MSLNEYNKLCELSELIYDEIPVQNAVIGEIMDYDV